MKAFIAATTAITIAGLNALAIGAVTPAVFTLAAVVYATAYGTMHVLARLDI